MSTIIAAAICALAGLYFHVVHCANVARHRMAALQARMGNPRQHDAAIALTSATCLLWALITLLILDRVAALAMAPA